VVVIVFGYLVNVFWLSGRFLAVYWEATAALTVAGKQCLPVIVANVNDVLALLCNA
jgi:hypothetical protein